MKILRSLKHALRGICYCLKNERNMRIHAVIAVYITVLSVFFNLSFERIMILLLTISAVISAEMVNTALETLTDMLEANYNAIAKIAKDVAAGAVLVSSIFAVVQGLILFSDFTGYLRMWEYFKTYPILFIVLILSILLSYVYISWGPGGIKNRVKRLKSKTSKDR